MPTIFTEEELGKDRVSGFYETPLKTVEYICNKVLPYYRKGMSIVDPSVGDGVFLRALAQAGVEASDLHGFDIDAEKVSMLREIFPNVTVFDATNPFPRSFDFVVGNPPYNGDESHFIRQNRQRLKALFSDIDAKNTFSMISYQAVRALSPGGVFSMILSDAFLTNSYYLKFREFLLRHLKIDELLLAPWKLFHGRAADVRTCIITGTRKDETDVIFDIGERDNAVRLVDRVTSESEYASPSHIEEVQQSVFEHYPNKAFLIGVSNELREIHLTCDQRLGDVVEGGTGISTGNDKQFLRKREQLDDDEIDSWVPYYKNGARRAYFYRPDYLIERDYKKYSESVSNYLIRNERFFFLEGVSCSSVGVRFSASYMPPGVLFGVNSNFFFSDSDTLYYTLALLNTRLAWYFARKILSRTNNISANYLRLLPYLEPAHSDKKEIATLAKSVVEALKSDEAYDFTREQNILDVTFNDIYKLSTNALAEIERFCGNFYERL